jgi:SAM-dependent methyltransferase
LGGERTDRDWEYFGSTDPYFAVLTDEKFRTANLTEEALAEFFRSGERDFDGALTTAREFLDASFSPKRALDFGCGVGRVTIPMARVASTVVGVDASASMLREAEKNCRARSIENVELIHSDAFFARNDRFNFIHSLIVFQHIPVSRGERIFQQLLDRLEGGGVCVAHFTYSVPALPRWREVASWVRAHGPFGRPPGMQMNAYDLNRLFRIIQGADIARAHALFTDHDGFLGVLLYCRRQPTQGVTSCPPETSHPGT